MSQSECAHGAEKLNRIITIAYASIQISIALLISVIGAVHVKRCMNEQKKPKQMHKMDETITLNTENSGDVSNDAHDTQHSEDDDHKEEAGKLSSDNNTAIKPAKTSKKSKGFCELWLKTIWKMRGVYGGLAVHSFDVLTDILVIIQWLNLAETPQRCHENVDPQIMAWSGIIIMIISKVISTVAIFITEGNIRRAIMQIFDLLIFEEIYESHKKIVSQIRNKKSIETKQSAIESTLSFKYIRNFEACFESIPQSVLQLVFIMRIESNDAEYSMGFIFIISIVQSVISMTNSILNNDNTQMQDEKWKKHKQRFPPTLKFLKHALFRLSEVIYRIGLLALFWTVCGGLAFSILLIFELLLLLAALILRFINLKEAISAESILLHINSSIVIPSEEVYSLPLDLEGFTPRRIRRAPFGEWCSFLILNTCCCYGLSVLLTSFVKMIKERHKLGDVEFYQPITIRIGVYIVELLVLIFYGVYGNNGENRKFLLSSDHGLSIFIATCVSFLIYTQYMTLFPDFALPLKVSVRSKYGYAYSNELSELKKIKVRKGIRKFRFKDDKVAYRIADEGRLYEQDKYGEILYEMDNDQQFWDQPFTFKINEKNIEEVDVDGNGNMKKVAKPITAGVYALANGNLEILSWLEEQGAIAHQGMDASEVRELLKSSKEFRGSIMVNNKTMCCC